MTVYFLWLCHDLRTTANVIDTGVEPYRKWLQYANQHSGSCIMWLGVQTYRPEHDCYISVLERRTFLKFCGGQLVIRHPELIQKAKSESRSGP